VDHWSKPRGVDATANASVTTCRLEPALASAHLARSFVARVLDDPASDCVFLAQLLATELVTNAVLHAGSVIELQIDSSAKRVLVSVHDASPAAPQLPPLQVNDATGGRGLQIVAELSIDWGWEPTSGGKRVWFELGRG
jgi:anti-sigma regulatory factor (Ser/Thr protein kinase)